MHHEQRGGILANRLAEDLGHANHGGVQAAHVHDRRGQHPVARVEQHHAHLLLLQQRHLVHQDVGGFGWRADLRTLVRCRRLQSAAQLEGGLDLDDFGRPQALLLRQLGDRFAVESGQSVCVKQALRQIEHVLTAGARAQDYCQQLSIG